MRILAGFVEAKTHGAEASREGHSAARGAGGRARDGEGALSKARTNEDGRSRFVQKRGTGSVKRRGSSWVKSRTGSVKGGWLRSKDGYEGVFHKVAGSQKIADAVLYYFG